MEIIDRGDGPNADLAQVAFIDSRAEGALVRGLLLDAGIRSFPPEGVGSGPAVGDRRRIYVRGEDAAAARKLLGETMVEEPPERPAAHR